MSSMMTLVKESENKMSEADKRVHLVGVSGSGMLGLASLLLEKGVKVSGSDIHESQQIKKLVTKGLDFTQGHDAELVLGASEVIYSSAIPSDNVERLRAHKAGIEQIVRAKALAKLTTEKKTIVVAGMHGKTTVTSMIAHVLRDAGSDPGFYVGAEVTQLNGYAHWGKSSWMVIEGDESDGSLLEYEPTISVLLNVEAEHLDHFKDLNEIRDFFSKYLKKTKDTCVACVDCPEVRKLLQEQGKVIAYGFSEGAKVRGKNYRVEDGVTCFEVLVSEVEKGTIRLKIPGQHNALNALATVAVAAERGISFEDIVTALNSFEGASRRFDVLGNTKELVVIDDYAHHPTEIAATIRSVKERMKGRPLLAAFQPHRYTRVANLWEEFVGCFAGVDRLCITEIYAASEENKNGITGDKLADEIRERIEVSVDYCVDLEQLEKCLIKHAVEGGVVLVMGAGDISKVAKKLASHLLLYERIGKLLEGEGIVKLFEPLHKHTTLRVGGPCHVWCEPENEEALRKVVEYCDKEAIPHYIIGRGSNLLVRDGGIPGVCFNLSGEYFNRIEIKGETLTVGAGVRLKDLVYKAKKQGIGGLEFMEGIPGVLGGALCMNAGAMNAWMFEVVVSVRVMTQAGHIKEIPVNEIEALYRNVPLFKDHIALSAVIQGVTCEEGVINQKLKEYSKKRWGSQPAAASAGCSFKNTEQIPTGKLVDELGLKNTKIGGARISDVHGNFIVNDGGAKAADVLALVEYIKKEAKDKRGIELEAEMVILGEDY